MENSVVKFSGFIALNGDVIVFVGEDKKTVGKEFFDTAH